MMAAQALHSRLQDLAMFLSSRMAHGAVQNPWDVFAMGERNTVNLDFCVLESLVALGALRVSDFGRLGQRNGSLRVAG